MNHALDRRIGKLESATGRGRDKVLVAALQPGETLADALDRQEISPERWASAGLRVAINRYSEANPQPQSASGSVSPEPGE